MARCLVIAKEDTRGTYSLFQKPGMSGGRWSHIETVGQAIDYCTQLFDRQLNQAILSRTKPNEPAPGDSEARAAFLSLLPPSHQRSLFLSLVRRTEAWPRIRTLVGSPPFSFLKLEDDGVLRAAGITRGRVHMASPTQGGPSSSSDFGVPQFVDDGDRDVKFVATADVELVDQNATLPFKNLTSGRLVMADVRLKRRRTIEKTRILRNGSDAEKRSLKFPGPGSRVVLHPNASFRGAVEDAVALRVRSVLLNAGMTVARIVAVVD